MFRATVAVFAYSMHCAYLILKGSTIAFLIIVTVEQPFESHQKMSTSSTKTNNTNEIITSNNVTKQPYDVDQLVT